MKRWVIMIQLSLLMLIAWQVWGIRSCRNFNTYCEDCAGTVYNPGCGARCWVGDRLDNEAYVCCCSTTTKTGLSACCEGRCVRWDCLPKSLGCTFDVQFMGVVGMKTNCNHTGPRDMEGHCTSGGPGVRCP